MIPESFIQEVLNRIDVVDIVDQRVKLKKLEQTMLPAALFIKKNHPLLLSVLRSSSIIVLVVGHMDQLLVF